MFYNVLFCLTLIFGIIILFQNVDSGCRKIKTTNCKVLKTIDTCLIKDVSNPWKAPEHKVLYDYISTGYKAGDEFFLMPEVVATYEFGKYKQVFKGSHQHPNSNKVQTLMIKFFTGEGPMEEQNNLLLELLNHAKWALASHKIMKMENLKKRNFIWTQPIIASCPNLFINKSSIAFMEPKIDFKRYECGFYENMAWWEFNYEIKTNFGFFGLDEQGFDCHDFGKPFYNISVMTDVMIEIFIKRGDKYNSGYSGVPQPNK